MADMSWGNDRLNPQAIAVTQDFLGSAVLKLSERQLSKTLMCTPHPLRSFVHGCNLSA
ncbi:hypothetical protein NTG1052_570047 [Candidatus Nitrotoga sp. 1052]|nr:hypothetical protein NTG1052_570047 [Candidatus Nitrotoga sp. 1052]